MNAIICPTCLGAKCVPIKEQGRIFRTWYECPDCEGLGEIPAPITTPREYGDSIRHFIVLPEVDADHPGCIQSQRDREPSPEALARAEALIRRCFHPSRDHVPSEDGAATEFVPNDLRLLVA